MRVVVEECIHSVPQGLLLVFHEVGSGRLWQKLQGPFASELTDALGVYSVLSEARVTVSQTLRVGPVMGLCIIIKGRRVKIIR